MTSSSSCASGRPTAPLPVRMSCSRDRGELWTWSLLWLRVSSLSSKPSDTRTLHRPTFPPRRPSTSPSLLPQSPRILLISRPHPESGRSHDTAIFDPWDDGQSVSLSVISRQQALRATGRSQSTSPHSSAWTAPCSTSSPSAAAKSGSILLTWASPWLWRAQVGWESTA